MSEAATSETTCRVGVRNVGDRKVPQLASARKLNVTVNVASFATVPMVCSPLENETPPDSTMLTLTSLRSAPLLFLTTKETLLVSPGSIKPLAGKQLSAISARSLPSLLAFQFWALAFTDSPTA